MAKKHVYYSYVDDMEAKYGDGRSNRTLIAELSGKERASERQLHKAVAGIVSSLYGQWDREKHAAFGKDEHKTVDIEPELLVYPDGSKKFSCTMSITHLDFSLLALDLQETSGFRSNSTRLPPSHLRRLPEHSHRPITLRYLT